MMGKRQSAFDGFASAKVPNRTVAEGAEDARLELSKFVVDSKPDLNALAERVGQLLFRQHGASDGPGYALIAGCVDTFPEAADRENFHRQLFPLVWDDFKRRQPNEIDTSAEYECKEADILDGGPPQDGQVRRSFKELHTDRFSLLFSHLYGPLTGFTGGGMLIADMRDYMSRHGEKFDDVMEWQVNEKGHGRPVVRSEHFDRVFDSSGVDLGFANEDTIWFVNNAPASGILHGVTPTSVVDESNYVRRFIRCHAEADWN